MNKKTLMEFGLRALREQTPPIPKVRPTAPPRPDVFNDAESGNISVNRDFNQSSREQGQMTTGFTPPSKASNTYLPTGRTTPDGKTYTGPLRKY